jgi:hypothetical protein
VLSSLSNTLCQEQERPLGRVDYRQLLGQLILATCMTMSHWAQSSYDGAGVRAARHLSYAATQILADIYMHVGHACSTRRRYHCDLSHQSVGWRATHDCTPPSFSLQEAGEHMPLRRRSLASREHTGSPHAVELVLGPDP